MSDRVRFGTWNDTGTPVASSGFNGFPAPTVLTPVSGKYPTAVALTKLLKWFWRVRRWDLSTDFSVTAGANTVSLNSDTCGKQFGASGEMSREMDHVYQSVIAPVVMVEPTSPSATGLGALILFYDGGFVSVNPCPAIYFDGTHYYPGVFMNVTMTVNGNGGSDTVTVTTSCDPADLASVTGSLTMNIDGEAFTLYYNVTGAGSYSYTVTTFDLTPSEFWPYAALDASPIYDTSTGAQLQSPLN